MGFLFLGLEERAQGESGVQVDIIVYKSIYAKLLCNGFNIIFREIKSYT